MPFSFKRLSIPEVFLIEPIIFNDERGFFMETYKFSDFSKFGIKENIIQENHSKSSEGVLRGLHYQKNPKAQSKLVRCVFGEIFDVAVDIRRNSPTYGKWVAEILSEENKRELYIPEGFAHGFCVLSKSAEIIYKVNKEYSPENERGIIWNDSEIRIDWPLKNPLISEKDKKWPILKEADNNFEYEQ